MLTEPAPAGTVIFLFTDIEGSTRRWELCPEAMTAVLARHDTLLRQALQAEAWTEIRPEALRAQMDATAFAAAWAQGRALDTKRTIQYAVTPANRLNPKTIHKRW